MIQIEQEELKRGNEKMFNHVFNEYYTLLCAISYHYVQDTQISEEIAEDVFCTLWNKRRDILPVASLKAFLIKSVRNLSIDYLRQHPSLRFLNVELEDSQCFIDEEDLFEEYIAKELEETIEAHIASLPKECREVFYLSRYENKSYAEIAEQLDISINTVKYHIKNALLVLRKKLSPYLAVMLAAYFSFFSDSF